MHNLSKFYNNNHQNFKLKICSFSLFNKFDSIVTKQPNVVSDVFKFASNPFARLNSTPLLAFDPIVKHFTVRILLNTKLHDKIIYILFFSASSSKVLILKNCLPAGSLKSHIILKTSKGLYNAT